MIVPVLLIAPVIVPLLSAMPEGLIVPSFVIEPLKLVLVTQKPATVVPIGLSVVALTGMQAAHADGIPMPINSATSELDASKLRLRYCRPIRHRRTLKLLVRGRATTLNFFSRQLLCRGGLSNRVDGN